MRLYDKDLKLKMTERITKVAKSVAEAHNCTAIVKIRDKYPAVLNHSEQTKHVIRLAKKHLGPDNFSQDDLPLSAGEDFSYFLQEKPGCFYTLGTMKEGEKLKTLHTSNYDYNDDLIATGAYFYLRIVEDRLGVEQELLPNEDQF